MNTPSQSEANKVLRVISGQQARLRFTCTVNLPDGSKVEFQSESAPQVKYDENTRAVWLMCSYKSGQYDRESHPVMEWANGSILLVEENPGHADSDKSK